MQQKQSAVNALVLSGGALNGAWQAGAISGALHAGFVPDIIIGISVGALNGAMLAQGMAHQPPAGAADALCRFWTSNVKQPADLIIRRTHARIVLNLLSNRWMGLYDSAPLAKLVQEHLSLCQLRASPCRIEAGAVSLDAGLIAYHSPASDEFKAAVLASAAIPVMMPSVRMGGEEWVDGGARDCTPLGRAISMGAGRIVVIDTHPKYIDRTETKSLSLGSLASRLMDIIVHETVANDLSEAERINQMIGRDPQSAPSKRKVDLTLIRPARSIGLDITKFTAADIARAMGEGRAAAEAMAAEFQSSAGQG